jgi:hypothetical protein
MTDEMERICKETIVNKSKKYPKVCLEELKKTSRNLVRVVHVPPEILTKQPQNTSL